MKNLKNKIPQFVSEKEEKEFWDTHDSTDFIDWAKAKKTILPHLKPSLKNISIRLPEIMIEELKTFVSVRQRTA